MVLSLAQWPHEIHVIGMGGIGTHVLQMLLEHDARQVNIWDKDVVEAHNIPSQFLYCPQDIGHPKVESAEMFVEERGFKTEIIVHDEWATGKTKLSGIVISGVDSMKSRADIWKAIEFNFEVFLYIDGRIGADGVQVHTVDPNLPDEVKRYKSWLFPDSVAQELGCATREAPHSAWEVAKTVSTHLALYMRGEPIVGFLERDLLSESRGQELPLLT